MTRARPGSGTRPMNLSTSVHTADAQDIAGVRFLTSLRSTSMAEEDEIHRNKRPGKTYISKRINTKNPLTGEVRALRIASKVLDGEAWAYAKELDEVVLRQTPKRRKEIIVKFLEDDRKIRYVTFQSFDGVTGNAHQTYFTFRSDEIDKVWEFLDVIRTYEFESPDRINVTDEELRRVALSRRQAHALVVDNEKLFAEILRSALTQEDVVALGYRKEQVRRFDALLNDKAIFEEARQAQAKRGDEAVWQAFFEANAWIFGYGLSHLYLSSFDDGKLERAVRGHDVLHSGKVSDGLLRTRGLISTLCFAEIKTHRTPLLEEEYRTGCWAPSRELVGAVAQVQTTVAAAIDSLGPRMRPKDGQGAPLGFEIFNFRPKAFIVVGNLKQLVTENGVHEDKLRSFEQFRNGIQGIEILTFDELFERSKFIVDTESK